MLLLPSLDLPKKETVETDRRLVASLIATMREAGVEIAPELQEKLESTSSTWRHEQVDAFGAAYLAVALHAGHLHSLVRKMQSATTPHPHGNTPRMLVFKDEFDAVVNAGGGAFVAPVIAEAQRLNSEIRVLQRAKKEADSALAALQRIFSELSTALSSHEVVRADEVLEAAAAARDLAHTELRMRPETSAYYPDSSQVAAAFFPIKVESPEQLRVGDVLFHVEMKSVLYRS